MKAGLGTVEGRSLVLALTVVPEVGLCVWHTMHLHPSDGPPPGTWPRPHGPLTLDTHSRPWHLDHPPQTIGAGTYISRLWDFDPLPKALALGLPLPGPLTSTADSKRFGL